MSNNNNGNDSNNDNNDNNDNGDNHNISLTGNIHTPNQWVVINKDDVPEGLVWAVDLVGNTATYYKPKDINYTRWLYQLSDLNKVHPSKVTDHTLEFYLNDVTQSRMVLDLLIEGTIQPIQGGVVFFSQVHNGNQGNCQFHAVFLSEKDQRFTDVRILRILKNNRKYDNQFDITFEQSIKVMGFNLLPDYYA